VGLQSIAYRLRSIERNDEGHAGTRCDTTTKRPRDRPPVKGRCRRQVATRAFARPRRPKQRGPASQTPLSEVERRWPSRVKDTAAKDGSCLPRTIERAPRMYQRLISRRRCWPATTRRTELRSFRSPYTLLSSGAAPRSGAARSKRKSERGSSHYPAPLRGTAPAVESHERASAGL